MLHEALTKRTPAYHNAAILILNGTRQNLCSRSTVFIYQADHLPLCKDSITCATEFLTGNAPTTGIDYHITFGQELTGNVGSGLKETSSVLLKVDNQVLHTLLLQFLYGIHHLLMSGLSKVIETYQTYLRRNHIGCIYGIYRNLIALDIKIQRFLYSLPYYAQMCNGTFGTAQTTHNLLLTHLHAGNGCISHTDDTVTCHDAHLLAGTLGNGLYNQQRIVQHIELHTYTLEAACQRFCKLLSLRGIGIG